MKGSSTKEWWCVASEGFEGGEGWLCLAWFRRWWRIERWLPAFGTVRCGGENEGGKRRVEEEEQ